MGDTGGARGRDKRLFTPGPLTTSPTVKGAMLRDLGSRDRDFIEVIRRVRAGLLALAGAQSPEYEAILLQGSGTYALEAVAASVTPPDGRWLVAINGAYGRRYAEICRRLHLEVVGLEFDEDAVVEPGAVAAALEADPVISHVALVHCETTSGIVNPVDAVGAACRERGTALFVDAMSSFGAIPLDIAAAGVDYLASSANKCIEGVPGFSFVLARRASLLATDGYARSVVLDLLAQWRGFERDGQFRFTPPTHALMAFDRALAELADEGGVAGRAARYRANHETLITGMRRLGFREFLAPADQSYIITTFYCPSHPAFEFDEFYRRLSDRGLVIYPGKVGAADCFRIGTIGRLFPADIEDLLGAVGVALDEMGVELERED
jgi:2-aminoethylphosphonate-pyruvate transaminase